MTPDTATLALEDGTILRGAAFGTQADAVFEPVFNTSMTGYQEILTDPSYRGQGVAFTASHIGNVGVNAQDVESQVPQISAVVVRSLSPVVSNWRATRPLPDWLAEHGVPGIGDVDTRSLTHRLREGGTLRAALSTQGTPGDKLLEMTRAWPARCAWHFRFILQIDGRQFRHRCEPRMNSLACGYLFHDRGQNG